MGRRRRVEQKYGHGAHTESYTYDAAGNIQSFNNGTTSHSYTYGNANWKDLLTAVDGHTITYDAIGNPTSYYDGSSYGMTWTEGRQLKTLTSGSKTYTYSYDRSGLRTRKQGSDRSEIRYHNVDGKSVVEVRWGAGFIWDCTLSYEYDETGSIIGFSYIRNGAADWTKYHFAKNLMGDVVAVYDDNGTKVASYTYDAWGNVLSSSGSMANVNPFRYRGYYCDAETKFYYLQSRYYDSAIGRFINADSYASTGQGFIGCNMFAYCGNNPVICIDSSGAKFTCWDESFGGRDPGYEYWREQFMKEATENGIKLYYSVYDAAKAWAEENRSLSETHERMSLIYVNEKYGFYFYTEVYEGSRNNVIFPTIWIHLRRALSWSNFKIAAQIHSHPLDPVGYHSDFPSTGGVFNGGGDEFAVNLFRYPEMYVVPYHRCESTPEIIVYSDRSTWCQP